MRRVALFCLLALVVAAVAAATAAVPVLVPVAVPLRCFFSNSQTCNALEGTPWVYRRRRWHIRSRRALRTHF